MSRRRRAQEEKRIRLLREFYLNQEWYRKPNGNLGTKPMLTGPFDTPEVHAEIDAEYAQYQKATKEEIISAVNRLEKSGFKMKFTADQVDQPEDRDLTSEEMISLQRDSFKRAFGPTNHDPRPGHPFGPTSL